MSDFLENSKHVQSMILSASKIAVSWMSLLIQNAIFNDHQMFLFLDDDADAAADDYTA